MSSERDSHAIPAKPDQQEMQRKMLEIGARYLKRTIDEIGDLRRMVGDLPTTGVAALRELEVLSHRIRGSGAVFGFEKISDVAGEIETLAVAQLRNPVIDTQLAAQFNRQIDVLNSEVSSANATQTS